MIDVNTMPMQPPNGDFLSMKHIRTESIPKRHFVDAAPPAMCNPVISAKSSSMNDRIFASSLVNPLTYSPSKAKAKANTLPTKYGSTKLSVIRGKKTSSKPLLSKPLLFKPLPLLKQQFQQQRKKGVRFSKSNDKEHTITAEDTSPQQLWYQPREFAEMDQESLKTLLFYDRVNGDLTRLHPDIHCIRGLEMKASPHINQLRRLRARISVQAVLDAQNYCKGRSKGTSDVGARPVNPEVLATVSRRYTQQARSRARELGLIDSIESKSCAL